MRIFYLLALLTVIGSCTITKRVHNPGWHVEWRSKQKSVQSEAIELKTTEIHNEVSQTESELPLTSPNTETIQLETQDAVYNNNVGDDINSRDEADYSVKKSNGKQDRLTPVSIEKSKLDISNDGEMVKTIHPFAVVAGILLLLSILIVFVALFFQVFIMLLVFTAIPGLVFSIIGIVKTARHRDRYFGVGILIYCLGLLVATVISGWLYMVFEVFSGSGGGWL